MNMPANKNAAKLSTRDLILDTAAALFFREGFRAIGVDTIIERSGVAKMTLYRHFHSKEALIVAYLERSNEQFWGWFEQSLGQGSAREKLEQLFAAVGELANKPTCYGCTFQSAAAEFPNPEQPGHAIARQHKEEVIERLAALAAAAGAADAVALANQLLLLMDGAFAAARMFGRPNPAAHIGQAARILIAAQLDGV
jgi:AcrR family transcriptional regulator